jgi:hypothetical protein
MSLSLEINITFELMLLRILAKPEAAREKALRKEVRAIQKQRRSIMREEAGAS